MITRQNVKEKSEELNIPFSNMLSLAVCQEIIELISDSSMNNDLYLSNGAEFNEAIGRRICISTIKYEYTKQLDDKMRLLYLRDILKEILKTAAMKGFAIDGTAEEKRIRLNITVDEMYVPVVITFEQITNSKTEPNSESMKMIMYENKQVEYLANSKEEILVKDLVEIIEKLELINNMDPYYEIYSILENNPINGRKVKDSLTEALSKNGKEIEIGAFEIIKSYRSYSYMKKKWKVELRQKKVSQPTWEDTMDCLIRFLGPIWDCVDRNLVFLGDWMPQIKRFLD